MINIPENQKQKLITWLGTGSINIFGPQYAGKDTQGNYLVELLDTAPLIGGGDILRNSTIPPRVKEIMNSGSLIPTKNYIEIVLPYLAQPEFDGMPLVLSAVGRWHGEEEGVLKVTSQSHHQLKAVVYISLDETVIWNRWRAFKQSRDGGMRNDETEQALQTRLEEFREKTLPVIDFYQDMGIVIKVNGNQTSEKVFSDIIDGLLKLASS